MTIIRDVLFLLYHFSNLLLFFPFLSYPDLQGGHGPMYGPTIVPVRTLFPVMFTMTFGGINGRDEMNT